MCQRGQKRLLQPWQGPRPGWNLGWEQPGVMAGDGASFPSNTHLCGLWDHSGTLDWAAAGTCWSYPAVALQDDLLNVFLRGTEVQSWAMSEPAQLKPKELSAAEGEIPAQESPWWLSCDWGIFCESHRSLDSLQKHFEALRGKCEPGQCTQGKFCLCVLREGESRECISEWALEISPCLGTKQLEECHGLHRGAMIWGICCLKKA